MTKRIQTTEPTQKLIQDTGQHLPRIKHSDVAAALGAECVGRRLGAAPAPLTMFLIREELFERIQSSGERYELSDESHGAKIPLRDEEWLRLEELAGTVASPGFAPSAGQLASVLLTWSLQSVQHSAFARVAQDRFSCRRADSGTTDEQVVAGLTSDECLALSRIVDDLEQHLFRIAQVTGGRVEPSGLTELLDDLIRNDALPVVLTEKCRAFVQVASSILQHSNPAEQIITSAVVTGASLVGIVYRQRRILELEYEFASHGLWQMAHHRPRELQRFYWWSAVAASFPEFDYDYDIYTEASKRHNAGKEHTERGTVVLLPIDEFVMLLEFRQAELLRVLSAFSRGQEAFCEAKKQWHWPREWGDVGWNETVVYGGLREVETELLRTRNALRKYRARLDNSRTIRTVDQRLPNGISRQQAATEPPAGGLDR